MRIGVIGALDEEVKEFSKKLKNTITKERSGLKILKGSLGKNKVFVIKSGVGKVNASRTAQILISELNCDIIINTGLCGSINETLNQGALVVFKDCIQHDVRAESWGFKRGQIPLSDLRVFESNKDLLKKIEGSFPKIKVGRLLTGDLFLSDSLVSKELSKELLGDCVDMEGAAVGQVCTLENIPFILLKVVSDNANEGAKMDFDEFTKNCSKVLSDSVIKLISQIKGKKSQIKDSIRTIPHFPKQGIMFRDITTLLLNPTTFREVIDEFASYIEGKNVDAIFGIESRGFIFGAALSYKLGIKFVPIRKKGKLPGDTVFEEYELEYGKDKIEVHADAIKPGERVVLVDDLIATGGTAKAAINLIKKLKGELITSLFLVNLPDLGGLSKIGGDSFYLVEFEGD